MGGMVSGWDGEWMGWGVGGMVSGCYGEWVGW